jgi:hypothetical protein
MSEIQLPEPWLRGTLTDVSPVLRAVLHALELAREDIEHWCGKLTDEQLNASPSGVAPIAFHVRHIARSGDRLLTYAEGSQLNEEQIAAMKAELDGGATWDLLFAEFQSALVKSGTRIRAFDPATLDEPRKVGKKAAVYNSRWIAGPRGGSHAAPRGPSNYDIQNSGRNK